MELSVALLQTDIAWEDAAANRTAAERLVERAETDLALLPEMFATGFVMQPAAVAEPPEGPTAEWMMRLAARTGTAIAGSVATCLSGSYVNRFLFASPQGELFHYDKHHLFAYGGETESYTPGMERVVFSYKGFGILPLVCYDLRFPVWCRNRGDYDLILCCASWPASRIMVWDTLLRARAIENQCYVAGVNRVGADPAAQYVGHSAAVDFRGEVLAAASCDAEPGLVRTVFDRDALQRFRIKFPAWADADPFELC